MAATTKYLQGYPDPNTFKQPLAIHRGNAVRVISGGFTISSADGTGSVAYIGKIPSSALLLPIGVITYAAIAGLTSASIGFPSAPNALVNALSFASAGSRPATASVAVADLMKRAWELAGFATDPGRELDLIWTNNTDPSSGTPAAVACTIAFVDVR